MASIEPNNDLPALSADSDIHALGADNDPIAAHALGAELADNPIYHGKPGNPENPTFTGEEFYKLHILGATYGLKDVTAKVISCVNQKAGFLFVLVNNKLFGETWRGVTKSLTIVYRCGQNGNPKVLVTKEGDNAIIRAVPDGTFDYDYKKPRKLQVLGASYGAADVTEKVKALISSGQTLDFVPDDHLFTDTWHGNTKSFTIVARYTTGNPFTEVVKQGQRYTLRYKPPLSILGAVFGVDDVSSVVLKHVHRRMLVVKVDNATFGKGWTEQNSLSVLYQYGHQQPQLVTAIQGHVLVIDYTQPHKRSGPPPTGLEILGATYGVKDVTERARALVSAATGLSVVLPANTATFGEGWQSHPKSMAVFYRYGPSTVKTLAAKEHDSITIPLQGSAIVPLGGPHGFFHSNDHISITSSSSNKFWKVNPTTHQVFASEDSNGATTFTVTTQKDGFLLRANDKYLAVSDADGTITASAAASKASTFYLFALPSADIVIGTSAGFCRLDESSAVIADCKDYFSLVCSWQVTVSTTEVPPHLAMHSAAKLDDCDESFLKVAWDVTGGFLFAVGIGPIDEAERKRMKKTVANILKSNKRVYNALKDLAKLAVEDHSIATAVAAINILLLAYSEGVLWPIVRTILGFARTWAAARVIAKIIQLIFKTDEGKAELVQSLRDWNQTVVLDAIEFNQCKP